MAKQSGMGWTTLDVDNSSSVAQHLKNDITQLDFDTPVAVQDVTGIDKFAHERIDLLSDFTINLTGVFNTAAGASHQTLKDINTGVARNVTAVIAAQTLANLCLFTGYTLTRSTNGDFTWKATASLSSGTLPAWS
jgi:hypothetical protein